MDSLKITLDSLGQARLCSTTKHYHLQAGLDELHSQAMNSGINNFRSPPQSQKLITAWEDAKDFLLPSAPWTPIVACKPDGLATR